ncbi:MAG: hypothetical protein JWR77_514, partial [Rhizorhabdus sp.]|nr:hypothetical protein [Rhizorhabdus sp.]
MPTPAPADAGKGGCGRARRRIDLAKDVKIEREGDVPWIDDRGA